MTWTLKQDKQLNHSLISLVSIVEYSPYLQEHYPSLVKYDSYLSFFLSPLRAVLQKESNVYICLRS